MDSNHAWFSARRRVLRDEQGHGGHIDALDLELVPGLVMLLLLGAGDYSNRRREEVCSEALMGKLSFTRLPK